MNHSPVTPLPASAGNPTPATQPVRAVMAGLGTVGFGVYTLLQQHPELRLTHVAVRDINKAQKHLLNATPELSYSEFSKPELTDNTLELLASEADIVIELMGGLEPAKTLVTEAIKQGKHVVTANKELMAKHGPELFTLAEQHNVRLLFEGAVAGGIPIIQPLHVCLAANTIEEIAGIINGTTNYILTKMTDEGWSYTDALAEAQQKGFAEADPSSDVDGWDTAYKIAILSAVGLKQAVDPLQIYRQGITHITAADIEFARTFGYVIKLLGYARKTATPQPDVRVHPMLIPQAHPLASIRNEFNAVWVKGNAVDAVTFSGRGAGAMPTASAVCGDILALTHEIQRGHNTNPANPFTSMSIKPLEHVAALPITQTINKYYIRLNANDRPGVMGHLGVACGDAGVSLESVMQKCTNPDGTATIVLITHDVQEAQLNAALENMKAQPSTQSIDCVLRVLA